MIFRNIKITFRQWSKQPVIAAIKVICLTLGIASTLVIAAYVDFEKGFDKSFPESENISRVTVQYQDDGRFVHIAKNYSPLADILRDNIASLKGITRMFPESVYVSTDASPNDKFRDQLCFVDSTFLDVFPLQIVESAGPNLLATPFSIVLTEKGAMRVFGRTHNVVSEKIQVENDRKKFDFTVTAVVKDLPEATHFDITYFASFSTLTTFYPNYNNWHYPPMFLYLRATPGADHLLLQNEIQAIAKKFQPAYVNEEKRIYELQRVADIHLYSSLEQEWKTNGNIAYVTLFTVIGAVILALACINYINLSNASALKRMKEVGIRKVSGAARNQLFVQFMTESFLTTLIAFFCALVLSELSLVFLLSDISEKPLSLEFLFSPFPLGLVFLVCIAVSFLAGTYPALFASGFNILEAVKGITNSGFKLSGMTRVFVTLQFFVATVMTIFTFIVLIQIAFLNSGELGFAQDEIVCLHMPDKFSSANVHNLKEKFMKESMVVNATVSSTLPGEGDFFAFPAKAEGHETGNDITFQTLGVDEDFLDTYRVQLKDGNNFSKAAGLNNNGAFIINESAARAMGWTDPIGKRFSMIVYTGKEEIREGQVIGVVEDFHFKSLYEKIEPLVIYVNKHVYYTDYLSVRVKPGNLAEVSALFQTRWKEFNNEKPIELSFLNDRLDMLYKNENKRGKLLIIFTSLCLVISSLGLFALTAQAAESKTKESGIRKVLGASPFAIGLVLAKPMFKIIIVANIVAIPIAWLFSNEWLSTFAYHVTPAAPDFIIPIFIVAAIGLATMATHIIRIVSQNPINALKRES
jgi:putative ABC transport system permease protein